MRQKLAWFCLLFLIILTACSSEISKSTISTTTNIDFENKEIFSSHQSSAVLENSMPTSQSSSLFPSNSSAKETNSLLTNTSDSSSYSETTIPDKHPIEQDIIPKLNESDALDEYNQLYSTPAPTLIFHVMDAQGNPIPELPITIDPNGQNTIMLSHTDKNGNAFWRHPDIGTWDIVIDEQLKVFQKQKYQVIVTPELTSIILIWNFEDPSKLQIPTKSSILISVVNEKGEGISEVDISVGIFANEAAGHTKELLLLGKTDLKGQKIWTNPDLGLHQLFLRYGKNKYEFSIEVKEQKNAALTFTLK